MLLFFELYALCSNPAKIHNVYFSAGSIFGVVICFACKRTSFRLFMVWCSGLALDFCGSYCRRKLFQKVFSYSNTAGDLKPWGSNVISCYPNTFFLNVNKAGSSVGNHCSACCDPSDLPSELISHHSDVPPELAWLVWCSVLFCCFFSPTNNWNPVSKTLGLNTRSEFLSLSQVPSQLHSGRALTNSWHIFGMPIYVW